MSFLFLSITLLVMTCPILKYAKMHSVEIDNLLAATNGRLIGADKAPAQVDRVVTDSRGDCTAAAFWALHGQQHDGHDHVNAAFQNGASLAVIDQGLKVPPAGALVKVTNTLTALGQFAGWYRQQHDALVIGVTGSVGKTTTRNMIHACLSAQFTGCCSPGNYNNAIGVPFSLLEIEAEHEFAAIELGASAEGEIRDLTEIAHPEIGVVTAIAPAHIAGFGDEATIVRAKGELIEMLPAAGLAVLNGDDPRVCSMRNRADCKCITVGCNSDCDLQATNLKTEHNQVIFELDGMAYHIPVLGEHHIYAALSAIALGREFGMDCATMQAGLNHFQSAAGRCQPIEANHLVIIDDTYNANPGSVTAACNLLSRYKTAGNRILVLGDMYELGTESEQYHEEAGFLAASLGIDRIIACGQFSEAVISGAHSAGMSRQLLSACHHHDAVQLVLSCWVSRGDAVLIKGSRSMQMEAVTAWLQEYDAQIYHELASCA